MALWDGIDTDDDDDLITDDNYDDGEDFATCIQTNTVALEVLNDSDEINTTLEVESVGSNSKENENSMSDLQMDEDSVDTVHEDVSNSMATVDDDSVDTRTSLDTVAFVRTMGIDVTSSNNSSPGGSNDAIISDPMDIIPPDVDEVLDLSSAGGHALIENNVYFTKPKEVIPVCTNGVLDLSIKGNLCIDPLL